MAKDINRSGLLEHFKLFRTILSEMGLNLVKNSNQTMFFVGFFVKNPK
jgi:hypothetical protein